MKTPDEIKKMLKKCPNADCSLCQSRFHCDLEAEALEYIQQLEEKVPKWISVEERLPEKLNDNNQMYITEEVIGFDGECAYIGQYKVYKYDGHLTFFDGNYFRDDITHWMPMPEPPKEE